MDILYLEYFLAVAFAGVLGIYRQVHEPSLAARTMVSFIENLLEFSSHFGFFGAGNSEEFQKLISDRFNEYREGFVKRLPDGDAFHDAGISFSSHVTRGNVKGDQVALEAGYFMASTSKSIWTLLGRIKVVG